MNEPLLKKIETDTVWKTARVVDPDFEPPDPEIQDDRKTGHGFSEPSVEINVPAGCFAICFLWPYDGPHKDKVTLMNNKIYTSESEVDALIASS